MLYDILYPIRIALLFAGGGYLLIVGSYYFSKREKYSKDPVKRKKTDTKLLIHVAISSFIMTLGLAVDFQSFSSSLNWFFVVIFCNIIPTIGAVLSTWIFLYFIAKAKENKKIGDDL